MGKEWTYIFKSKNCLSNPNISQIQLRTFVACMFANLEKIEFLISFPEIFYILFSKAKGPK